MINYITEALQQLNEMAYKLSEVRSFILNTEKQRIQNLLQIYLIGGKNVHHWCNELCGCCPKNYKLKSNKDWVPLNKLRELLVMTWETQFYDTIDADIEGVLVKEFNDADYSKIDEFSKDNLHDFMVEYNLWLANKLSEDHRVSTLQVEEVIKDLLTKYR